ncbi:cold-shock protein [Aeromonas veronii]
MDNNKDGQMRYQGRIASWNEARGFGFITPEQNGAEQATNGSRSAGLFVHVTALQSDGRVPELGERVTYLIGSGQDGKPRALKVFFPDRPLTLADAVPSPAHVGGCRAVGRIIGGAIVSGGKSAATTHFYQRAE